MITDAQIEAAKKQIKYLSPSDVVHEHNDCIRFAYEWLDAQTKIKGRIGRPRPIKHLVERWAERYVSQSDVEVAALMHPDIRGTYPFFNISVRLTEPSKARLLGMAEAGSHAGTYKHDSKDYSRTE